MANAFDALKSMTYEEFLQKLEQENECPCCPLLDRFSGKFAAPCTEMTEPAEALVLGDFVIHQMHKAIQMEDKERIRAILDNVHDITLRKDYEGSTILQFALALKAVSIEVIEMLIEADPNLVNVADYNRFTPLHQAVWNMRLDLVCLLLRAGALPNTKTMVNETTLHFAAARGNYEIIKYLVLEGRCDTKALNNYGSTPLGKLCAKYFEDMENKVECVKFLLKHTYAEDPQRPGLYKISDIFEPALLNLFSPRRKPELDCIDEVTTFFVDTFYGPEVNSKYKLIEKLSGPLWKLCLFLHDDITQVNDFIHPGLRNILTYTKELNQLVYSFLFVNLNFDEESLDFICDILTELFAIGLRSYLEKEIFTNLLLELFFMKPKPNLVRFARHLIKLKEPLDFNTIYQRLVRRLTLTKSLKALATINPLILPFCTFVDPRSVVEMETANITHQPAAQKPVELLTLKEMCRKVIRFCARQSHRDSNAEFIDTIMALEDLPVALRLYLRFIESGYSVWAKHYC